MLLAGKKTKVGIAVPQMFPYGPVDMALVEKQLRLVESLGYDSVWTQDSVLGTMDTLDPFTLLAYASTVTERVNMGISVLVTPFQNPIHLAKISASLDQLSGGRFILGVGIGGHEDKYPAFGFDAQHRVTRFEHTLDLVKRLWTEPSVTFKDRFWDLQNVSINPKPLQSPRPPIWFGARAEPALRRAVRIGDGWMGAGSSSTNAFKRAIGYTRSYMEEVGRDRSTFPLGKRVYVAIDNDRERAARRLEEWFGGYYHDAERARKVSVFGSEEEVIDGFGRIMEEDPDMIMFNPVFDLLEHSQRLASDIVPKL